VGKNTHTLYILSLKFCVVANKYCIKIELNLARAELNLALAELNIFWDRIKRLGNARGE
jgi:hypothetical protein